MRAISSAAIANAVKRVHAYPDVPNDIDESPGVCDSGGRSSKTSYGNEDRRLQGGSDEPDDATAFHVDQPVLGVLPASGRLSSGATLAMVPGLKIEVEIGYPRR